MLLRNVKTTGADAPVVFHGKFGQIVVEKGNLFVIMRLCTVVHNPNAQE